jgi:preprotein translocase subunit SecF
MVGQIRNIDFLKFSRPFALISAFLVIASWVLIISGQLKLGIDFAGGTEALVSMSQDTKVSDQDLKSMAEKIGLQDPEIVEYKFQEGEKRKGFFIRSTTQRGLIADKAIALRTAVEVATGKASLTWTDNSFVVGADLSAQLIKAVQGKLQAKNEADKALVALAESFKTQKVTWDEKSKKFTYAGDAKAKDALFESFGKASIKLWDISDESGERIRVQFHTTPMPKVLKAALTTSGVAGGSVSAENETRNPVFIMSADDSLRLKDSLFTGLKALGNSDKTLQMLEVPRFEKVGATAGQQLRNKGILAVVYTLIFILLYIAIRFDPRYSPGAIFALFHDVSITLGLFCLLGREFNLPIIAALLAIVGYSLNDTIVVYDRIRENILQSKAGQKLSSIINVSLNDCLSRTILTSVTTFLAVLAIKLYGGGIIENFAFAMLVGVLVGTYSSIYIASPIVLWMDNYLSKRDELNAQVEKALQ